jgi:hypothetical protein
MKFIKPNEISGKIITLLEESDKYAILITPYVKISQWTKLTKKLDSLLARKVQLRFYIREDAYNKASFEELDSLNYPYTSLPNLHCKIYLNEKYGIVTSMNLLLSSELNSLEIGYITDTPEEHQELIEYCKRYFTISIGAKKEKVKQFTDDSWKDYIIKNLEKNLSGSARYNSDDADYRITTFKNNYDFFIYKEKKSNNFRIKGILSALEYEAAINSIENLEKKTGMKIALYEGGERHYASVWGTLQTNLKSSDIKYLEEDEKKLIADSIIKFITAIDKFKDSLYNRGL